MMITTSPSAAAALSSFQPHLNSGAMDTKPPQLMPIAALHPPQFFITGGGYTVLPMHAAPENFPGGATLHPIGQFSGGRPLPGGLHTYYNPSDMYHQIRHSPSPLVMPAAVESKHTVTPSNLQNETKRIPHPNPAPSAPPLSGNSRVSSPGLSETPKSAVSEDMRDVTEVKREPTAADEAPCSANCRGKTGSGGGGGVGSSRVDKGSYSLSALIDVPNSHSSRTSSLSSSLSSFRFGGSLSQIWASQLSLSKVNMKSTGNLHAEPPLPSLGNQYLAAAAFGGSLPELSVTSLSRLLPSSTANDPSNLASCPNLLTLFHSPLYVYPSQHHLSTPFINANGSITFGSFLSSGTSLCSTQNNIASHDNNAPPTAVNSRIVSGRAEESSVSHLLQQRGHPHVAPPLPSQSAKPYSGLLPNLMAPLPPFSSLTQTAGEVATFVASSSSSAQQNPSYVTAPTSNAQASIVNLNTLACVATAQPSMPLEGGGGSGGGRPQSLCSPRGHPQSLCSPNMMSPMNSIHSCSPQSKGSPQTIDGHPGQAFGVQEAHGSALLTPKLESDPFLAAEEAEMHTSVIQGGKGKRDKDRPYKCDHPGCGRSFSFPAHLRSHIQQIHVSYRPCKCEFPSCGKRFYTPQHLNVHRRVHTGERPFVCPYTDCVKAFTTAGNLKNHIRTHTGERPYACKFEGCAKRFAEMSSLKKHELTHTGEKPYKCRVCGKAFSQAGSRNTHERKHSRTEDNDEGKSSRRYRIKRVHSLQKQEHD